VHRPRAGRIVGSTARDAFSSSPVSSSRRPCRRRVGRTSGRPACVSFCVNIPPRNGPKGEPVRIDRNCSLAGISVASPRPPGSAPAQLKIVVSPVRVRDSPSEETGPQSSAFSWAGRCRPDDRKAFLRRQGPYPARSLRLLEGFGPRSAPGQLPGSPVERPGRVSTEVRPRWLASCLVYLLPSGLAHRPPPRGPPGATCCAYTTG
jgi:hypothetical protein